MQTPKFTPAMTGKVRSQFVSNDCPTPDVEPGDFLLSHASPWRHWAIKYGQGLRIHGKDRPRYTGWTHAALVVSPEGKLVEAVGSGVRESDIKRYADDPRPYRVVHIDATAEDRQQVVDFACWALKNRARYNFWAIRSITLSVLTGCKFTFFVDGEFHCSGLVARALERTDARFTLDPVHIMPADLAKYFQVPPPPA